MNIFYHIKETGKKLIEIAIEGRDWLYLLVVFLCIVNHYGIYAAGQMVVPLFMLHSISIISNFGLHGHLRHVFQNSELPAIELWKFAFRARLSLLIFLLPLLLLLNNLTVAATVYGSIWLMARFMNEVQLVGARFNHRLNDWLTVRIVLYLAVFFSIHNLHSHFQTEEMLLAIAIPEFLMTIVLLLSHVSLFPVTLLPRIDFTQLKMALPHFYAQLIFTFNYYLLILPIALTQPLRITAEFFLHLLMLVVGLVPAYLIWNDYRNARPSMSESDLTAATLALIIRGTIASTIAVISGITLQLAIADIAPDLSIALPLFMIMLSQYYTIPGLHALTEEGKLPWLLRLWIISGLLQIAVTIIIINSSHQALLFPVISMLALAQSLMVFLMRQMKMEVQA